MVKSSTTSITPATHAANHSIGGIDPLVDPLFLHAGRHAYGGADPVARGGYTDETGVKIRNTEYQNPSATRPMLVTVAFLNGAGTIDIDLGAVSGALTQAATGNAPNQPFVSFIVPPDWYYQIGCNAAPTNWYECVL